MFLKVLHKSTLFLFEGWGVSGLGIIVQELCFRVKGWGVGGARSARVSEDFLLKVLTR